MLIISLKPGEHIDRALKRYKQKVRKVQQIQKLRSSQEFTKKSVSRRAEIAKAVYKQNLQQQAEQ